MSDMAGGPLTPLQRYLDATEGPPPPDLAERIGARLLLEPRTTAPRRFLAALRARHGRGILRGLGQNAATAFRPGSSSLLVRGQAMAILLVVGTMVGFGTVAGLAATQQVAQHVVGDSQENSTRVTRPPSAAPALVVAPTVVPPSVAPTILPRGASESSDRPVGADQSGRAQPEGRAQPQGLACGFSVNGKAGDGSIADTDRCPDPPGRDRAPAGEKRGKGVGAGGKGKSDPPAAKATNKGRGNETSAGKASKGKTPDAAKKADKVKTNAAKKADKGKADRPAANGNATDQGPQNASSSRGASRADRERP